MFGMATAAALICAVVAAVPSPARPIATSGFGTHGRVATIGGLAWPSGREYTAVAGDGDIYVAAAPGRDDEGGAIQLRRYLPDGRLDPSFGEGGGAVTSELQSMGFHLDGLLVDTNGLPYLIGTTGPDRVSVARLTGAGALDETYGEGGVASLELGPGAAHPRAAIDQADRVILAGGQVARLTPEGALDRSFGEGGTAPIPGGQVDGLGVDEKGRIQLTLPYLARDDSGFRLMRLAENGRPDRSLGPTGIHIYKGIGAARALAVRSDGSTIVLGTVAEPRRSGGLAVWLLEVGSRGILAPTSRDGRQREVYLHEHSYTTAIVSDPNGDDYLVGTRVTRGPGPGGSRHQGLVVDLEEGGRYVFDSFGVHQRVVVTSPGEVLARGLSLTDGGRDVIVDGIARPPSGGPAHGFLAEYPAAEIDIAYVPEPVRTESRER